VLAIKEELTIDEYCHSPDSKLLRPFIEEVWGLQYEEKPNYGKLKFLLVNILLSSDDVPKMNLLQDSESVQSR
jgi:hypothetical protein